MHEFDFVLLARLLLSVVPWVIRIRNQQKNARGSLSESEESLRKHNQKTTNVENLRG